MTKKIQIFLLVFAFVLFSTSANAANALFDAAIRSVDKKFSYYDKEVKKAKFGNTEWEKRVESKKISIEKAIKKLEKKWPKENLSSQWEKLEERNELFAINSKNVIKDVATKPKEISQKTVTAKAKTDTPNSVKKVDRLLQLALKSIDDKFKDYDTLLAQKKYGLNQWFSQLKNKKKILVSALNSLQRKWPNQDVQRFFDELETREKDTAKNTYLFVDKIVKSRFVEFKKHMKQNKYGKKKWDEGLKKLAGDLSNAINYFSKKWPDEAKVYKDKFQLLVSEVKGKNQAISKAEKQKTQRAITLAKVAKASPEKKVTAPKTSLLAKVKKDQANHIKNGKIEIWDNTTGNIKRSIGDSAYLSFSSDYAKSDDNKVSFSGKEYIYAHLHLSKNLTDLLPNEFTKRLNYYKLTIIATVESNSKYQNDKTQKNSKKLQRVADFKLSYNTKELSIAVVPERGYFESILDKYRSTDKFSDNKIKEKAFQDLLSRNFSRQISLLFKKLPVGEHQVEMEFKVLAKLNSANYYELQNMKGTFLLNVDQEAKERYKNTFDMLTKLYRVYDSEYNITVGSLDLDAEKKKLAAMSPMKRECYHIAKRSPDGYMACYKGEKSKISFRISPLRGKAAFIDITWPKGSCERCMAGSEGGTKVRKNAVKHINIPNGAKVSINGRTLINSVSAKEDVILHWYY